MLCDIGRECWHDNRLVGLQGEDEDLFPRKIRKFNEDENARSFKGREQLFKVSKGKHLLKKARVFKKKFIGNAETKRKHLKPKPNAVEISDKIMDYNTSIPKEVSYLTVSNLVNGMVILAAVKDFSNGRANLVLPGGIGAILKFEDLSDVINNKLALNEEIDGDIECYIELGQVITVAVISMTDGICVSMRESIINKSSQKLVLGQLVAGSIKGIEDYGYSINLGIENVKGFLPFKRILGAHKEGEFDLKVGSPVICTVVEYKSLNGIAILACERSGGISISKKNFIENINLLMAGMKVKIRVNEVLSNGLWVKFMNNFRGGIDLMNVQISEEKDAMKSKFQSHFDLMEYFGTDRNATYDARILFVNPVNHYVSLTLLPNLVERMKCSIDPRVGDQMECVYQFSDARKGAFFYADDGTRIIVPMQRIEGKMTPEARVRVRVMGNNLLENYLLATAKKSEIEEKYFLFMDLSPGQLVRGKVAREMANGYLVELSPHISVFLRFKDMSDLESVNVRNKYRQGASITGRVLYVDSSRHRAFITCRKSLVNSRLPIVSNWDEIYPGMITEGTITKILGRYSVVSFYNGIRGISNLDFLSDGGVSIDEIYKVNQVVKCRVVSVMPEKRKLVVSFDLNKLDEEKLFGLLKEKDYRGMIVNDATVVELGNGFLKLSWNVDGIEIPLILMNGHLCDYSKWTTLESSRISVGIKIEKALIYDINMTSIYVTRKPSIINSEIPDCLDSFVCGNVYYAFIWKIMKSGLMLKVGHWSGFVSLKCCGVLEVDLGKCFGINQTVRARLISVDQSSNRLFFSLKNVEPLHFQWLNGYFSQMDALKCLDSNTANGRPYCVGDVIDAYVESIQEHGISLRPVSGVDCVKDGFKLFAPSSHLEAANYQVSSICKCLVLDIDMEKSIINVTFRADLIEFFSNTTRNFSGLIGKKIDLCVQVVKRDYLVLTTMGNEKCAAVVYMSTGGYNDAEKRDLHNVFCVGQVVSGVVKSGAGGRLIVTRKCIESNGDMLQHGETREIVPGELIDDGVVTKVKETCCYVKVYGGSRVAILDMSEVFDIEICEDLRKIDVETPMSDDLRQKYQEMVRLHSNPLEAFEVGQKLPLVRVIMVKKVDGLKNSTIIISIRPSILASWSEGQDIVKEEMGFVVPMWISKVTEVGLKVQIPIDYGGVTMGFVHKIDSDWEHFDRYAIGQNYLGATLYRRNGKLNLSMKAISGRGGGIWNIRQLKVDQVLPCRIESVKINQFVVVSIFGNTTGVVYNCDLMDKWISYPTVKFIDRVGEILPGKILKINHEDVDSRIRISFRPSVMDVDDDGKDKERLGVEVEDEICSIINNFGEVQVGHKYYGFVNSIDAKRETLLVQIGSNVNILVPFRELDDKPLKNPEIKFSCGQLVRVFVKYLNPKKFKAVGSLKESKLNSSYLDLKDLQLDQIHSGRIVGYCNRGGIVRLKNSYIRGLCPFKELLKEDRSNYASEEEMMDCIVTRYPKGTVYEFQIIHIDQKTFKVSLKQSEVQQPCETDNQFKDDCPSPHGDPPSYDDHADDQIFLDGGDDDDEKKVSNHEIIVSNHDEKLISGNNDELRELTVVDEDDAIYADFEFEDSGRSGSVDIVGLVLERADLGGDEGYDCEDVDLEREKEIERKERQIVEEEKEGCIPKTQDGHERAIIARPHSSLVWIRYMAYYLEKNEIEKTRKIGEEALAMIPRGRIKEVLNIWTAMMNLEVEFGTRESFDKLVERASKLNDSKTIYYMAIESKLRSKKTDGIIELYQKILKKWKHCASSWTRFGTFYFKTGALEEGRELMKKALSSLEPRKHIKVQLKFSALEFKYGTPERGRTNLETLVSSYPKRTDIWNVWIDLELSQDDKTKTRALFERIISLPLKPAKMKYFFKRYLNYELKNGTSQAIKSIKEKAQDYVQSKL